MFVYGFLRRGKGLRALFGDKYDEIKEKLKVSLHEWEDKFLLDFYVDDTYSKFLFCKERGGAVFITALQESADNEV